MVSEPYASLLERLLTELRREFGDKLVSMVLFGSVARGDSRRDSDIDLLLVIKGIETVTGRVRLFEKVEDRLSIEDLRSRGYDVSFSPVIKTPEEAAHLVPLYLDMVDDAVILYDKDAFFARVLERLRHRLSELGAERVRVGKKWYWRSKETSSGVRRWLLNSVDIAKSYLRQAEERVSHASEALSNGNYAFVVRQSQEAVELSLKAALRLVGIEPPKWHDVGPVLKDKKKRFPAWFEQIIDQLASISRSLRKERELAMHGDEESGASPDKLYSKMDTEKSLNWASLVLSNVKRLLGEQASNKTRGDSGWRL